MRSAGSRESLPAGSSLRRRSWCQRRLESRRVRRRDFRLCPAQRLGRPRVPSCSLDCPSMTGRELRSTRRGSSSSGRRDVNGGNRSGANRFAGSSAISAHFRGCSLLARHADRDAEVRRLLTRRGLCSLESFRNLRCGFLASHALEQADVIFRPRSPSRRLLRPCNGFSHVLSCLMRLRYKPRFA